VIDPVLHASSGLPLLERRAWSRLRELMAEATLVTPNLPEAEALTERDVSSRAGVESAARDLVEELGARAALVKGGHASGRPDDCLAMREPGGVRIDWLEGTRLGGGPAHGTGCALAAAVTASLARGRELRQAVDLARAFLFEAIRIAEAPGQGARLLGLPGSVGPHEPA
jgi:hydroxymethylpyrimidine/phosphomethylpyrimidine kinase